MEGKTIDRKGVYIYFHGSLLVWRLSLVQKLGPVAASQDCLGQQLEEAGTLTVADGKGPHVDVDRLEE